jgi:preprotein translocase subunit SecD
VSIRLDGQGARIMTAVTRDAVKRRMAVLLIEKGQTEVITAPVIQSELGASFQISGSMDAREARDLALLLRAGALAAPMEIVEGTVGPSLGRRTSSAAARHGSASQRCLRSSSSTTA